MNTVNRIALSFQKRASEKYSDFRSLSSVQDEELADQLFNIFESICTSTSYEQEDETTLDYETADNEYDEYQEDSDAQIEDAEYEEGNDQKSVFETFSVSYMQRALDYYDAINPKTGKRAHTWKSVQHTFKRIPHQSYMARFREYVEKGGTNKEKLESLENRVYNSFERARDLLCPVHDMDLKRWAIQESRVIKIQSFVASDKWILNFKRKHNICSRKITKAR